MLFRSNRKMKCNGEFITAYPTTDPDGYILTETQFTAVTQGYYGNNSDPVLEPGMISFKINSELIQNYISADDIAQGSPIDGWEANSYHVFEGWVFDNAVQG